ncbi:aminotransferase class I/II-fold pyridoxal phosphate-dependent enzyme [Aeromicrobium panaciterrae]|uniref:MalY/PatB family protein n=1 Tax=Aeromicrobium panaciterrae TaxID=363861 RepID=UPI0031D52EE9
MHPLRELTLDQLRQRTSIKWREYPPDVLPLWVAEMDVRVAEPVERALTDAVSSGDVGYPHGSAYAEAYADFAADRWGWEGADSTRTSLVADVMTGIVELLDLVSEPGDPVVVNPPVYPPFYGFIEHAGRTAVDAPLGTDGRLDLEALEAAFIRAGADRRPVSYLLCNPQNPTGTVHTAGELAGVAALADTYAVRVIVDEIHAPLVAEGFVPYLSVDGTGNAFSLVSASKAWNLAGVKAALIVCGESAADDLARLPEVVGHGPSHLGSIAHTVAFREGRPWLDALLADLADNRVLLAEQLATHLPAVPWQAPPAMFLTWLDCRALGLGDDPAEAFLERGHVALNSGLPFGNGAGHVRLNYATTPEILTEAVERMGRVAAV